MRDQTDARNAPARRRPAARMMSRTVDWSDREDGVSGMVGSGDGRTPRVGSGLGVSVGGGVGVGDGATVGVGVGVGVLVGRKNLRGICSSTFVGIGVPVGAGLSCSHQLPA